MKSDVLSRFSPATREWFAGTFGEPTTAQAGAWDAISQGQHTLVVAPTGSGKTLSAFLWALDRLGSADQAPNVNHRCRVLYISPMKALAVDVERNLRSPLVGISHAADRLGLARPQLDVAVRSGDTTPQERRAFAKSSADILITTPESLFLMLTSSARERLAGVEYVIVDEIHAVAGTKRGAHLAVSLDRLDELTPQPAQRIGLSATVRPVEEVERFLAGGRPVSTVRPPVTKEWDLDVVVPVEDMADLSTSSATAPPGYDEHAPEPSASIWPHVEERIVDLITEHTSTLVFANSRRLAERLTTRLNEIWQERLAAHSDRVPSGEAPDPWSTAPAPSHQPPSPAQMLGASGVAAGAPAVLARAHHGSVSKDVRSDIETELKSGRLPAVVATSSLELGIDMGAIDLVIQVESPPSVASGLQRIGRAGHQVGATSHGVLFPKYRSDLLSAAVVVERMRTGAIESISIPTNPLDVLAQHIVAMVAMDDWTREDLATLLRRSAPFATLPSSVLDSVLDMLAGLYPSDAFRELRPRLVWDRDSDVLTARPGAQRLAVTSGGTIPDRGLYGVFLASGDGPGRRVGELDEEMVYESRVGDIFTLGTSTWRIEDITRDQVLVTPAPGQASRLPFWKGDALGRPLELGEAIGAFARTLGALGSDAALARAREVGLDERAARNLVTYLTEQTEATGHLPSDRTIVVERFRDEMGDWRVVVHTPFGASVHAPWALCISATMREQYGTDMQAMHTDDGMVFRLLETEGEDDALTASLLEAIILDPDEISSRVTEEVGATPLFAARFRECAARALLLPRRDPGRRQALWQQRQRAAQLLDVARDFAAFPIVLEAVRECLQDVYDVPGLIRIMRDVAARRISVVHAQTATASPYAKGMLFSYVAQYLYEGDSPLAERRAAALSLDPELLSDLLGSASGLSVADLLSVEVVRSHELSLQRLSDDRKLRHAEDLADALRILGPLTLPDIATRSIYPHDSDTDAQDLVRPWWEELVRAKRAIDVQWGGHKRLAAVEDAGKLRDALGVALPRGVPAVFLESSQRPLDDLLLRYAATHMPFPAAAPASEFSLGISVTTDALTRLAREGRLTAGTLLPEELGGGRPGGEFADPGVLRTLRRRSLAAARADVEPVAPAQFARFLPAWQGVGAKWRGPDGVMAALEPLIGYPLPASAVESLILPARVQNYRPGDLDELLAAGDLLWQGNGSNARDDGWVSFHFPETAAMTLSISEMVNDSEALSQTAHQLLEGLASGGSHLYSELTAAQGLTLDTATSQAFWELVWRGRISGDTFAPIRALLAGRSTTHRSRTASPRTARYARLRGSGLTRPTPPSVTRLQDPTLAGRWHCLPTVSADVIERSLVRAETMLARHGIVTRGAVQDENVPGGFAGVYRILAEAEDRGLVRRGYFVESLGASQFGTASSIDSLRAAREKAPDAWGRSTAEVIVLAACDPANPFGAALPWPAGEEVHAGHRPGRKAGSLVALYEGELVAYLERGGRTALTWPVGEQLWAAVAQAIAALIDTGQLYSLTLKTVNGHSALTGSDAFVAALLEHGFQSGPHGVRKRR